MANKKKKNNALGGALTPALPSARGGSAPQTFTQFAAAPAPGFRPTASQAPTGNPFAAPPPTPTPTTVTDPNQHGTPNRQGPPPITLPGGVTPPNPTGMYDPALYADFVRHWYAMRDAKFRGDDTANYGAGPMRTVAF